MVKLDTNVLKVYWICETLCLMWHMTPALRAEKQEVILK